MPTIEEIHAQINALPHKYIFYTKKEIKYLPEVMVENERIMALTSGYMNNTTWLAVCTNRRVIFLDKGMLFGLRQVQMNLDRIQSIDSSYTIFFGTIRLWDGAASFQLKMVMKSSVQPFVRAVRNAIDDYRKIAFQELRLPPQHQPSASPAPAGMNNNYTAQSPQQQQSQQAHTPQQTQTQQQPPSNVQWHQQPATAAAAGGASMATMDSSDPSLPSTQELMQNAANVPDLGGIPSDPDDHGLRSNARPSPANDVATQLEKLAALKDAGHLTQAVFDAQKQKLLAG